MPDYFFLQSDVINARIFPFKLQKMKELFSAIFIIWRKIILSQRALFLRALAKVQMSLEIFYHQNVANLLCRMRMK